MKDILASLIVVLPILAYAAVMAVLRKKQARKVG